MSYLLPQTDIDTEQSQGNGNETDWLEAAFRFCKQAREPFEDTWFTCLLFLAGNQRCAAERDLTGALQRRIITPPHLQKTFIVDNRILISYAQLLANLIDNIPDFECVANTNDPDDIRAAHVGTRMLKWRDSQDKESLVRSIDLKWLLPFGEIIRRTWWDPSLGRKGFDEGDINTEPSNTLRYLKDPHSIDVWPPRYLIEYDARDVDEVKRMYGVKELEPENCADQLRYLDRLATNIALARDVSRESPKSSVVLKRLCMRPCERYPNGHYWVWASGKLLKHHDLQAGIWPYAKAEWLPIAGRLYPLSFVEILLSDQKQLNILESEIAEVVKKKVRMDAWVTGQRPQEEILPDGRKVMRLPNPNSTFKWEDYSTFSVRDANEQAYKKISDIKEKAGTNDTTLGNIPAGEQKATIFAVVKEADMLKMGWYLNRYASEYLCEINRTKIRLGAEYYQNERVIESVGQSVVDDMPSFRGADLGNTKDVIPVYVPRLTPAQRRAAINEATEKGLFGPWESPGHQYSCRVALRAMGLDKEEEAFAKQYGTLEEVQIQAAEFQLKTDALIAMKIDAEIMQLEASLAPPQPQPAPEGMPIPAEAVAPEQQQIPPEIMAQMMAEQGNPAGVM
ncbi:MAG: hypothetical protein ABFD54_04480 [Armatimonadota bacterium]